MVNWWYDFHIRAVVAEWLRRLTRNQIPSGSVGSNPTDCDNKFLFLSQTVGAHHVTKFLASLCCRLCKVCQHRWFSGRMLACHAGGPGSIPGRCRLFSFHLCLCAVLSVDNKKFWRRRVSIPVPLAC